jgi:predicted nucleotidyltransferase
MAADLLDRPKVAVPQELLDGVVAHFDPIKVIVFGSQARGDAGPDSDWDLLVIVDDAAPPDKVTLRAGFEATRAYGRAADVVPVRASTFAYKRDVVNSLSWIAEQEGVVVYERP